jgi:uncharacterized protein
MDALSVACAITAWIGHACLWTHLLNVLYSQPIPKPFLKLWRLGTGIVIAIGIPVLCVSVGHVPTPIDVRLQDCNSLAMLYLMGCMAWGALAFPVITVRRLLRKPPADVLAESSRIIDIARELAPANLVGDGHFRIFARLPFNDIYAVEMTDLVIARPGLPAAWDGLTILHLSDLHFHGTPARAHFERVFDEIARGPVPDIIVLTGDYVDRADGRVWLRELLKTLRWNVAAFAILGNHDLFHDPDAIREDLAALGITVVSNRWLATTIRGERCVVVGHEGPWFGPPPDLAAAPADGFRLGLSHAPDQFYWAVRSQIDLLFCGHVHGGQIRIPVVGSIFVPSRFGRRFDQGCFEQGRTLMIVSRGLGGKEPLRFRCPTQVIRVMLKTKSETGSTR